MPRMARSNNKLHRKLNADISNLSSLMFDVEDAVLKFLSDRKVGCEQLDDGLCLKIRLLEQLLPTLKERSARTAITFWASLVEVSEAKNNHSRESIARLLDAWQAWIVDRLHVDESGQHELIGQWLEELEKSGIEPRRYQREVNIFTAERIREAHNRFTDLGSRHCAVSPLEESIDYASLEDSPASRMRMLRYSSQPIHRPLPLDESSIVPRGIPMRGNIEDYWPIPKDR